MPVHDRERRLLAALELRGSSSQADVAKLTRLKSHTVAYCFHRLRERGVVGERRPIVDLGRLGFLHYTFLVALRYQRNDAHQRFVHTLLDLPQCTWLYEVGGEYQYGFSLSVRGAAELSALLNKLTERFTDMIFTKVMCLQRFFAYFGHRHLAPELRPPPPLLFRVEDPPIDLDAIDHRILHALALGPARITDAAKAAGVPLPTFERRKRALEERQIIRGYFHWINTTALGYQFYLILVFLRGMSGSHITTLLALADEEPRVLFVNECLGVWDFELGVTVKDGGEVGEVVRAVYRKLGEHVRSVSVVPVFRYVKFKTYPGLQQEDKA